MFCRTTRDARARRTADAAGTLRALLIDVNRTWSWSWSWFLQMRGCFSCSPPAARTELASPLPKAVSWSKLSRPIPQTARRERAGQRHCTGHTQSRPSSATIKQPQFTSSTKSHSRTPSRRCCCSSCSCPPRVVLLALATEPASGKNTSAPPAEGDVAPAGGGGDGCCRLARRRNFLRTGNGGAEHR